MRGRHGLSGEGNKILRHLLQITSIVDVIIYLIGYMKREQVLQRSRSKSYFFLIARRLKNYELDQILEIIDQPFWLV